MKKYLLRGCFLVLISATLLAQDIYEAAWQGDMEEIMSILKENPELINQPDEKNH
jgi:hypothetical protein